MTDVDAQPTSNRYLSGAMAPVADEVTAFDLPVSGTLPEEFEGRWLRNGPNPIGEVENPMRHHWFMGDGMVHGVRLSGGKAEWYRNRWVRGDRVADALGQPRLPGKAFGGRTMTGPNTNVGGWAGKTWAMVEAGGTPVELSYELESLAWNGFEDTLQGAFSAHPKFDPATRELHAMTYSYPDMLDKLQYVIVGDDGRVSKTVDIPMEGMPMVHDMSLTPNWAVIYDLGVTVRFDMMGEYPFPIGWNDEHATRVGLLPRNGTAEEIVWAEVDPCMVFHPLNAYEDDEGRVVIDLCRYERLFDRDLVGPFNLDAPPTLDRWTINPATPGAKVHEERVDDRAHEFPRHDPRVGLQRHQYGYTASLDYDIPTVHGSIFKTNFVTGEAEEHSFGGTKGGAEPVFIPREHSTAEDDGWIMVLVHDQPNETAELQILDAQEFGAPAVATIELPQRVPIGFHGNWVPG